MKKITTSVRIHIELESIGDLLTSAFEGGSNYWYFIEKFVAPSEWKIDTHKNFSGSEDGKHFAQDYPLNEGGALLITDKMADDPTIKRKDAVRLDLQRLKKGLNVMAKKSPKHFADFISDNADQETADVFLQCCIFGDIIYG